MMEISLRNEEMKDHLFLVVAGLGGETKAGRIISIRRIRTGKPTANEARLSAPGF